MFSRKNGKTLSQVGKGAKIDDDDSKTKSGDSKSSQGTTNSPFRRKNKDNPSKSESFKEKMIKKHMEKLALKIESLANAKSNDDDGGDGTDDMILERLEAENSVLASRCRKLEAQNIIAAAQMVDFIAVTIGFVAAMVTYFIYFKIGCWVLLDFDHVAMWAVKFILLVLPYIHNKRNYNITYRRFQVFAVAFVMIARVKLVRWRVNKYLKPGAKPKDLSTLRDGSSTSHFGDDITEDDVWESNYEINARFLYSSILRLRGLWTKTAQYLSSRSDFVPVSYVRELSKLQDEAPSTPWVEVKEMLTKAGILEHFSHIDEIPIASASIGQVHTATLKKSDEKVVIKCQHPNALTLLSDDFVSLRIIAKIVGILEPEYKFLEILMREWANEAWKELDFCTEVDNLVTAQQAVKSMTLSTSMLTNVGTDPIPFSVEIPIPIKSLSSREVMVMSFCEGKRIDDLDQIDKCNVPREAIMNAVAQVFAYMMYVTEIFNGDPHPGNLFIRPGLMTGDGSTGFTVVVLDWGLAKRLPKSKRTGFCQMTYAAATVDFGLMMDAFKTLGLKLKRENVSEDMEGVRFLLRDMAPRETAKRRVKSKMKTDIRRSNEKKKGERVPVDSNAYPGEFFFFVRTNELLHGLGSRLGVDMKYLDVLKPFAEKGLSDCEHYLSVSSHPDPVLKEKIQDLALQKKIDEALDELQKSNSVNGAQICVIKDNKILAHNVCGNLGGLKKHLPVRSDSLFLGFSVTKTTAATLANKMIEEGYMDLDEPICERIWIKFCSTIVCPTELLSCMSEEDNLLERWGWKRSISLRHILTHTSGLWFGTPAKLSIKTLAKVETCCEGFEYSAAFPEDTLLPITKPGSECTYQYLSFGWLVAGCVIGAYEARCGELKTYEEIYNEILGPLHSSELKSAGFKPCGGGGAEHDIAHVETELDITRATQMRKEAEAMGEMMEGINEDLDKKETKTLKNRKMLFQGIKGREFILDPRIWNSIDAIDANCPAAGGRFSAKGIALFYQELANGNIFNSPETLTKVTRVCAIEDGLQEMQGQSSMANDNAQGRNTSQFGLGYQIISIDGAKDSHAFGHSGVGGSIGFHQVASNTSVGIMFNKVGTNKESAKQIISIVSRHLDW